MKTILRLFTPLFRFSLPSSSWGTSGNPLHSLVRLITLFATFGMLVASAPAAQYAYVRSTVGAPWAGVVASDPGSNETAMNTTFGSGNWDDLRFETVNPATLFSAAYKVIFLEGSDTDATELETFLNANTTAMQNWVAAGGRLLLNAAPNEDNGMSFGFGVTLNYSAAGTTSASNVAAANAAHAIFTTPSAAGTAFAGSSFSHATVSGAGLTTLIAGTGADAGKVALAEMSYGGGKALFGGMTLAYFHSPKPQAIYLRSNILAYLRDVAANTLDTTFNGTGKVTTPIGSSDEDGVGVAVQGDGKIVVAGYSWNGSNYDFALVRYNADGSLDSGFGSGGKVTTPVGTGDDFGLGVALQSDGKIVVAGYAWNGSNNDFALVRYTSAGALDATFNGTGKVMTAIGSGDDIGRSVAVQSDGKIVVGGYANISGNNDFAAVRYNTNGSLDSGLAGDSTPGDSFGTGGKVTTPIGSGSDTGRTVLVQSDGKILLAGYYDNGNDAFALVRYTTSGVLDGTFGTGGKVTTDFASGSDAAFGATLQSDGKIVLCGQTHNGSNYDFGLARYNTNGSLDSGLAGDSTPGDSFGTGGKVITPVGSGHDFAWGVAVQGDGKLLAAGYFLNGSNYDFALVRYTSSGALDTAFGSGGKVTTPIGSGDDVARSIALQSNGNAVVAGYSYNGTNLDFAVVRYLTDSATQAPTLTAPATSSQSGTPLAVSFTLPEAALPGSVQLSFTGAASRTLTLAASQESSGAHSFSLSTTNLGAAAEVASVTGGTTLPDGTYAVTLSYRDAAGNAAATATNTNIVIDTVTQTPALTAPVSGSKNRNPVSVAFSLPEAAAGATVQLQFTGSASRTLTLAASQQTATAHSFSFDPGNPTAAPQVAGIGGGANIPDGTYTLTLSYQDVLANPAATASATNVVVDTTPPVVTPPGNVTVHATTPAGATVTYPAAMASDAVGVASLTYSQNSGTAFPNGVTTVTVTATDAANNMGQGQFTVTVTPLTTAENWRYANFGTAGNSGNAADNADPDGDGVINVMELAFGTDPNSAASGPPMLEYAGTFAGNGTILLRGTPRVMSEAAGNGVDFRALLIRRTDYAAVGLTYTVEFSATLGTWQASAATPAVLADDGTYQVVSVPYPFFVGGKKARFFRVRVNLAP